MKRRLLLITWSLLLALGVSANSNTGSTMLTTQWEEVESYTNDSDTETPIVSLSKLTCGTRSVMRENSDSYFSGLGSVIATLYCTYGGTYYLGLGLYKEDDLLRIISEQNHNLSSTGQTIIEFGLDINPDISPGEYKAKIVYKIEESEEWTETEDANEKYITLKISDTHMVVRQIPENYDDSNIVEYGVHTIDGITYRLYGNKASNNIRYCADVLPFEETGYYAGDIYIPDFAIYNDLKFDITECQGFTFCPELTSLSIPAWWSGINNCPKLKKIEFREGVTVCYEIFNCPELETVSYSSSCEWFYPPTGCEKLSSITVNNNHPLTIKACYHINKLPSLTDIYFTGEFPPIINLPPSVIGEEINTDIKVHIPSGTLETYLRTDWVEWTLVEDGAGIPLNVKLDYSGNDTYTPYGRMIGCIGNDVEIAMNIPTSELKAYEGCKITAIEYYNGDITLDGWTFDPIYYSQVEYVFLTSYGKDYEIKQEIKPIPGTWMRIALPEPYIITDNDIFVGVGRHDIISMSYANYDVVNNDSFQCRTMGSIQYPDEDAPIVGTWYPMGGDNHPFPIRVIVEGEHLPTDVVIASIETVNTDEMNTNRVSARSSAGSYTKDMLPDSKFFVADYHSLSDKNMTANPIAKTKGEESDTQTQLKLKVRNRSPRPVRNVTLNWEIDGTPQDPVEINTHLLTNHEDMVYVDIPSEISGHTHNAIFNVTDIDGEADEVPENSTVSTIFGTSSSMTFPRKYVMEEATGTWCQWCPRGMATIEHMKQQYPDNFIPIAIHYGDDMEPIDGSYEAFSDQVSGYPAALINRQSWIDVNPFELGEEKDLAQAMIKAYATFTDAGEIEVATETIFGFSERGNGDYRIAYVLLENNVGPYYQTNAYSNPEVDDDPNELMNWWIHQNRRVKMRFNHVARSIHDYDGIENQLSATFTEGETLVSMFTFPLPENVQDAENLYVVTLLIDETTGEILNADETDISGTAPAGIEDILTDSDATFDIYNLSGIRVRSGVQSVDGLPSGIYIINGRKIRIR